MLENAIDLTPYALDSKHFDVKSLAHWLESYTTNDTTIQATQLETYAQTLLEWNTSHNLSGAHTMADMLKHIIDSILPLRVIKPFARCLDIGSGAGLPALVLAIVCQDSHFILCEPRKKRAAFLRFIAHKLGLHNVCIANTRIEELARHTLERIDLITSRASLPNDRIFAITEPFGVQAYLLYKGEQSYHIALGDSAHTQESKPPPQTTITFSRYNARIYVYKELQCLD